MKIRLPPKEAIDAGLMRRLTGAFKSWEKKKVPASIYKEMLLPQRRRAPDHAWEEQAATARGIAEPALRELLAPLVRDHFHEGQRVLEVGAGTLARGRSYISRYFDGVPLSWTVSDTAEVLRRSKDQAAERLELDLTSGTAPAAATPFDRAVASNVFDTLPYVDFATALATVHRQVKKHGLFLHVADLNFYVNAFLDACGAPGQVLFPGPEPHKMLHALSKEAFRQRLEESKNALTADEAKFLAAWGKSEPQVQAVVIGDAFLTKVDMSSLSRRVESAFEGHLQRLPQIGVFQRALVAAAAQSGWQVLECGFRVAEVTVPKRSHAGGDFNRFELDEGAVTGALDPAIAAGQERVRAKAHVFLARSL